MKKNLLKRLVLLLMLVFCVYLGKAQTNYYVSTTGSDGNTGQLGFPKLTIQAAINTAASGDIINVEAGTYTEKLVVNKQLTILGPNIGIEGKSNLRLPEAKIIPLVSDIGDLATALVTFEAGSDGSVLDGFELNGDNSSVNSGLLSGGVDVDASYGIDILDANNVLIQNNILQNYGSSATTVQAIGITITTSNQSTVTSGTVIQNNYVKNIHQSAFASLIGIISQNSAYAQIKNNKVENVRTGIQLGNSNKVNPNELTFEATIENNEILAARGVYYNLIWDTSSPWNVKNNTISSVPLVPPYNIFTGIQIQNIQNAYSGSITGNTIDGKYADRFAENNTFLGTGILFKDGVYTTGTLLLKDNVISNVNDGITYEASGSNNLTTNVSFIGGEINNVNNNYVRYTIPSGNPTFADINLLTTKLDGKAGFDYTSVELANIFSTKIIDKQDNAAFGKVNLAFAATNIDISKGFATIQAAINDASTLNGHTINVTAGTYTLTTGISVTKELTIRGNNNNLAAKPLINGTDNSGQEALFIVSSPNVTIENFRIEVAQTAQAKNGIRAPLSGTYNNLVIQDNEIVAMSTQYATSASASQFGTFGIQAGHQLNASPQVYDEITIKRNKIISANANSAFGRAIRTWNTYGVIGGSLADKNILKAYFAALQGGIFGGGITDFSYNDVTGKLALGFFKSTGNIFANNTITSGGTALKTNWAGNIEDAADQFPALVEVISASDPGGALSIEDNQITDYKYIGVFVMASNNVTVKNNTLTPLAATSNFTSIAINTKTSNSNENGIDGYENISITGNTLNGSTISGGKGIWFANHHGNISTIPFTNVKVGGAGADRNTFSANLTEYIVLDNQVVADAKTIFPWNQAFKSPTNASSFYYSAGLSASPTIGYKGDIDAAYNTFGTINSETATSFDDLAAAKAKITDGVDNTDLGYVNIQPAKAFVSTAADLTNALVTVPEEFTIVVKNDVGVYGALGSAVVKKAHTFEVDNNTTASLLFTNFQADALAKEIKFSNPAEVTGNFTLTAGKITPTTSLTIDASQTISITEGIGNFVNGKLVANNVSSGFLFPVGKGSKAAYIALTGTSGTASSFNAEYMTTAYVNIVDKETSISAVSGVEHWLLNRSAGNLEGKIKLYAFDPLFSNTLAASSKVISFDGTKWIDKGNGANTETTFQTITADQTNSTYLAFTFGSPQPLPINLISFDAKAITSGALISWVTASEESNDKFIIEKSVDGIVFSKLIEIAAKGAGNYEYLDKNFNTSAYYRLVQVDASGQKNSYNSLVRFVKGLNTGDVFTVYPNPTLSSLYVDIKTPQTESIQLRVIDISGKVVLNLTRTSNEKSEIDFSNEKPGVYTLQLTSSEGVKYHKVIKQ